MTDTLRILVYAPGQPVDTGPEDLPIRARVLRVQVVPGGSVRYQLGWWSEGTWMYGWFPESEVRPI